MGRFKLTWNELEVVNNKPVLVGAAAPPLSHGFGGDTVDIMTASDACCVSLCYFRPLQALLSGVAMSLGRRIVIANDEICLCSGRRWRRKSQSRTEIPNVDFAGLHVSQQRKSAATDDVVLNRALGDLTDLVFGKLDRRCSCPCSWSFSACIPVGC